MGNYVTECPACHKPLQVSTGLFAKKKMKCSCGYLIDIAAEKMAEEICPHCGNTVVYDRSKSASATCPTCHSKIKAGGEKIEISCPSCKIALNADKNAKIFTCPQCKTVIDVQSRIAQLNSSKTAQIVKWDMGMNDIFIYRHPIENFKLGSQLIVTEGQKAIFFRNGQALDVFGPGRYTLETQNLPLIEEVLKYPTDADLTFDSQVYFVRTNRLNVKWGIPAMELRNPGMNFYVEVGASGSADMEIVEGNENIRKFLAQVIGASSGIDNNRPKAAGESYTTTYLSEKFRDNITSRLGSLLADIIISNNINILDLASKKATISDILIKDYNELLEEYGLIIPPKHFLITNIKIHNSEQVETWRRQEADRGLKVRDEEVLKAEAEARQGRVLVEEQTEAQRRILRTQGEGEERKISAQADADVTRFTAQGDADATVIASKGKAEASIITGRAYSDVTRLTAQGDADATVITSKGAAEASLIAGRADADVTRLSAQGNADATVITGKANAETSILTSRAEAEGFRLTGQASAEAYTAQAIAEAEEMRAKGYTYEQETSRQLGLEALQNGLPGTGGGSGSSSGMGSALGDMVGLGIGMSALGGVVNMTKDMMNPIVGQISDIGKKPDETVAAKSNLVTSWNCSCGKSCITSKFCPECGNPKPITTNSIRWNCSCGRSDITSNFCPDCGSPKPKASLTWNCPSCGCSDISSNFCPNCGQKRGD